MFYLDRVSKKPTLNTSLRVSTAREKKKKEKHGFGTKSTHEWHL